jgi:hypothetical protein
MTDGFERRDIIQGIGLFAGAVATSTRRRGRGICFSLRQKHQNLGGFQMNQPKNAPHYSLLLAVAALVVLVASADHLWGQQTSVNPSASASEKPFLVEWVYKVKWGHADEFWQIFKKYQIPVLNRQKELGYVISYTVYRPGFHTGEDTRWEYRIVIAYKNLASSRYGREVTKQLFPDQATLNREDNRRWELTEAHYDLPIRIIDPNGDGEE